MRYEKILMAKEIGNLESFPQYQKGMYGKLLLKLACSAIETASKLTGLEIGVIVPKNLREISEKNWKAYSIFLTLRKLGIAENISFTHKHFDDEPPSNTTHISLKGISGGIGYSGNGRDAQSLEKTLWPAIGEAVERWSLRNYEPSSDEILTSSIAKLKKTSTILDPDTIAGFSTSLRAKNHPRFTLAFDEKTVLEWVKATSFVSGKNTHIPLQLVSLNNTERLTKNGESLLSPVISTGAAAGQTLEDAILSGILEVIERDAFMIYWLNSISPERIDISTIPDKRFGELLDIAERYQLELRLLNFKTDAPVYTMIGLLFDKNRDAPAVMLGSASSPDFFEASYKALSDVLTARGPRRKFLEDNDFIMDQDPKTLNYKKRLLYWCDPKRLPEVQFLIDGPKKTFYDMNISTDEKYTTSHTLSRLKNFFRENDYEVVYKELLSKKMGTELDDMQVVFVRIPKFQPLHLDETLPAFWGERLNTVPKKIGALVSKKINTTPHIFP